MLAKAVYVASPATPEKARFRTLEAMVISGGDGPTSAALIRSSRTGLTAVNAQVPAVQPLPRAAQLRARRRSPVFRPREQVDDLLGRLRRTRFLAVVGGSGSGKSSLVKSGLMPSLRSGYMAKAGSSWRVALLRPGADPIGNLASALDDPGVLGGDSAMDEFSGALLGASLRRSGQGLVDALRQARLPPGENVLVVVDQFEELFRFKQARAEAGGRDEAVAFVKLLLEAARQNECRFTSC